MQISTLILTARKDAKVSREKLAENIGVATTTVLRWEKGQMAPSFDAVQKIADFLNLPLSYFSGKKESLQPQQQPESISNTISLMTENMKRLQEAFGHVPDDIIELLSLIDNEKAWKSAKLYLTGVVQLDTKNSVTKKEEKKEIG